MKTVIFIIFISLSVFASQGNKSTTIERKIVSKIVRAVAPNKDSIKIYLCGKNLHRNIYSSSTTTIVNSYDMADLVIVGDDGCRKSFDGDKPIIVLDYRLLKKYPQAIGAYYWQKGRPNIVMIAPRVKKMGIGLPEEFNRYTESHVW